MGDTCAAEPKCNATPPEPQQFGHIRIENGPISISISYGGSPDFTEKAFEKAVESGRDFIRTLHEQHFRETQRTQMEDDAAKKYGRFMELSGTMGTGTEG